MNYLLIFGASGVAQGRRPGGLEEIGRGAFSGGFELAFLGAGIFAAILFAIHYFWGPKPGPKTP